MPSHFRRGLAALVIAGSAGAAGAQQPQTVVRVRVIDTTGAPVANAEVSALREMDAVVPGGPTDATGIRHFVVPRNGDVMEVIVRKIGLERGDHFFRADRDSVSLLIRMRTTPHELPAVQVTAEQSLKEKRYHVTADDIAASKRLIQNGLDVVTKMRPDMMDPPGQGIFTRCGLYYVWVNGTRIIFPPIDPGTAIKASQQRRAARAAAAPGRAPVFIGTAGVPVTVQSVLMTIHPEHIEEMNYVDCRDGQSTDMARGQNAVFVVLKPGIGFEPGKGSYVLDRATSDAADAMIAAEATAAMPALTPIELAPFRHRLVGVFDDSTGLPIPGADVVDVASGTFAKTTSTGTVTLGFLPEGLSTIQIRRAGYSELKLDVSISPRDTMPLTLVLTPKPK